ncbi:MAG: c-type cytochrome [Myxococcota bacterium]
MTSRWGPIDRARGIAGLAVVGIALGAAWWAWRSAQVEPLEPPAAPAADPALDAGERLYREGIAATGEPVAAVVLGDVPIGGDSARCASCHGRSGMGTGEGGNRTPPLAAPLLFAADARNTRPAYTDALVARAVRDGVDSAGAPLDPLMPRFRLSDDDLDALLRYLHHLGAKPAPGVDDDSLHLATVIAGDVDPALARDVRAVLEGYVETKNAELRNDRARSRARRAPGEAPDPYRDWSLEVWTIDGPPDGWRAQLEARYAARPVFAMIGGLAEGPWAPIAAFCESLELPCVLPETDRPGPPGGFYTLYYSGGLRLEAEVVAADLRSTAAPGPVIALVAEGDGAGAEAAADLTAAVGAGGEVQVRAIPDGPDGDAVLAEVLDEEVRAVVAWLGDADLARLPAGAAGRGPLYLSATLAPDRGAALPPGLRDRARLVDPYRDPSERDPGLDRFRAWASARGLALGHERVQAQAWFACVAFLDGSKHVARYPQRDYLLDSLDHAAGLTALLPIVPRGTLGPGQRFLAKGARVVDLSGATAPRWITP